VRTPQRGEVRHVKEAAREAQAQHARAQRRRRLRRGHFDAEPDGDTEPDGLPLELGDEGTPRTHQF